MEGFTMIGRRWSGMVLSSLVLLAATVGGGSATQAQAQARDVMDCTGKENLTYGPKFGRSSEPVTVISDGVYHCTDSSGRVATAMYHAEGTTGGNCLLLAENQSREMLRYADGDTTVIAYQAGMSSRVAGANTLRLKGIVVAGRGRGAAAEKVIQTVAGSLPTDCAIGGGTGHATGVTRLSIRP